MKITVSTTVAAPLGEVWRIYSSPDDIKLWNAASPDWHTTASTVDLRVGGRFSSRMEAKDGSFGFDFEGTYTRVEPMRLIEYRLGDRVGLVEFSEEPSGVRVTVTFDGDGTHPEEQQRAGWQAILDSFARHVQALGPTNVPGERALNEEQFRQTAQTRGYGELQLKSYESNRDGPLHAHPFSVLLLVLDGEFALAFEDGITHFQPGEVCDLPANVLHTERAGPAGARVLLSKRHDLAA